MQEVDKTCRSIEADPVGQSPVTDRVVRHHDTDPATLRRCQSKLRPGPGMARNPAQTGVIRGCPWHCRREMRIKTIHVAKPTDPCRDTAIQFGKHHLEGKVQWIETA